MIFVIWWTLSNPGMWGVANKVPTNESSQVSGFGSVDLKQVLVAINLE